MTASVAWAKYAAIGTSAVAGAIVGRMASCWICGAVAGAVVGWATVALLAPVQGLVVAGDPVQISPRGDRVEP